MPTSPTDQSRPLVVEYDDRERVAAAEGGAVTRMLVVPGTEVAIHWLALAEGLTLPQATAAARLMLADVSAEPLSDMHVAVGRPEGGLTPVALTPNARMAEWIATDPDIVLPAPFLLLPPAAGLVRRDAGPVPDFRGKGMAFSVEPELAALLVGDAAIAPADDEQVEAGLALALAEPALNLRQGPFARRRQWIVDKGRVRRAVLLVIALAAITFVLQVAAIMRYAFAADRLEAEAAALGGEAAPARPGFGAVAASLFEAVRATPNVELGRIDYRPDGSLAASVKVDGPATLAAFRQRVEAGGLAVEGGALQTVGGQPMAELVLRPA